MKAGGIDELEVYRFFMFFPKKKKERERRNKINLILSVSFFKSKKVRNFFIILFDVAFFIYKLL